MNTGLFRLNNTLTRDPRIDAWLFEHHGELAVAARHWFGVMRECGDEVRELFHDGFPVACFGEYPFAYVNIFASHTNIGVFQGATLPDPDHLLEGSGKAMRHVKLKPDSPVDAAALYRLIKSAYVDIKARVEQG